VNAEEGMFQIDFSYGVCLLRDAKLRSIEHNYYLPPDLYASHHLFGDVDLRPQVYLPSFDPALLDGLTPRLASYLASSETLLEEPFLKGGSPTIRQSIPSPNRLGKRSWSSVRRMNSIPLSSASALRLSSRTEPGLCADCF